MGDLGSVDTPWGRRLVICCDGTWQSSVSSEDNVPSNVTKLCRVIARIGTDSKDPQKKWHQLVYYDSGVGTGDLAGHEKKRQGGTGAGLAENVIEAYNFIVLNYQPGDEIFCFGFSRGAYTARAVAGLVSDIGVIRPIDMQLFPQIYRAYMSNNEGLPFRETQAWKDFVDGKMSKRGTELSKLGEIEGSKNRAESWEITPHHNLVAADATRKVKVVGVWDTVGSLGIPDVAFFNNSGMRTQYGFHNVRLNENIEHAFHALALDERRKAFRPTLWYIPKDLPATLTKEGTAIPELKQVWFPGVHINCGGGSDDAIGDMKSDMEHLSTATFAWMLHVVSPYLTIDQGAFKLYMSQYQRWLDRVRYACTYHHSGWKDWFTSKIPNIPMINPPADPLAPPKRDPPHTHPTFDYGWGTGPIIDSYEGFYKLAGAVPRVPGACQTETYDPKSKEYKLDDMNKYGETNEYIHPICEYRKIIRGKEDNSALKAFSRKYEKSGDGKGRFWWYRDGSDKPVPEWVVLEHHEHVEGGGVSEAGEVNFERAWYEQCEKTKERSDILKIAGYEKDFLDALDEKNDFTVGEKERWVYP
ncbi:hypothetical protein P280DRAFT_553854 [Massarina eburnea CBS 473.64]|uniref:T6SS Phospholipase effector Tle1-like catalytic domain-containing protein n=1 Tax=Massarina eburnea CBS 473.64 TaxID=1395130 RepID=A0A6A6RJX1_9PLEO|nr:hypothetical protein P280DRAFT_553854 [Massarina eburnea CBS 473.64]